MSRPHPAWPILLVDDEEFALASYGMNLRYAGLTNTISVSDPRQVEAIVLGQPLALVLLDLSMPHLRGEELLQVIQRQRPGLPVIIVTGENDVEKAVACMRAGAADYLVKPVERALLLASVREHLSRREAYAPQSPSRAEPFAGVVGAEPAMVKVMAQAVAVAVSDQPVLIVGETGAGKEMFAQAIHAASSRSGKFVGVNVAGLDEAMFADTLFGHRKGAFTGATQARAGLIEEAAGGTLFLDEIGDVSPGSQLKLLRVLQEGEYYPLGADAPKRSDVRLVTATNQPLGAAMGEGRFREDLYFRLRTHLLTIPPLRERPGDLAALSAHFLAKAGARLGQGRPVLRPEVLPLLAGYEFPGNVRELEAMVFNAVALHPKGDIPAEPFAAWIDSVRSGGRQPAGYAAEPETLARTQRAGQAGGTAGAFAGHRDVAGAAPAEAGSLVPGPGRASLGRTVWPQSAADARDAPAPAGLTLKQAEEQAIAEALRLAGGNQSQAARILGITRQALNKRLLAKRKDG